MIWIALAALLFAAPAFADRDDDGRWGPGPGYGRGPGMMGGGPGWGGMMGGPGWGGMMGGGPGMMWGGGWMDLEQYSQIPADKRAKLRDLSVDTQRKMVGQMAAMHELMLAHWNALNKFPVDKAEATKTWEGLNLLRKQMFEARLDATAKAQEILGKELWEKFGGEGSRRGPPERR
jgi:Spy/CpxP family protein refolding chaperone